MPWTLFRYILKDLGKLLALSTSVLVVVIAFAASIKPLADGLLGPVDLIKFLLFTTPTVLPLALPFAGAFTSTLVFSRLSADNEVLACRAAGMSYTMILLPVLLLGAALMVAMYVMSNWVVPKFFRAAEQMIQQDVTRLAVTQVSSGRPVRMGKLVLYADAADDTQPPPTLPAGETDVQPFKLVMFRGVVVGEADDEGRIRSDSTAQRADALFFRDGADTWVTVRLRHAMVHRPVSGDLVYAREVRFPQVRLPNPFSDDTRFLSWNDLRRYNKKPELYDDVRRPKRRLVQTLAGRQLTDRLAEQWAGNDEAVVFDGAFEGEQYHVTAPSVTHTPSGLRLDGSVDEPVRVELTVNGEERRRMSGAFVTVKIEHSELDAEPRVRLHLIDARVSDTASQSPPTERESLKLPTMRWPDTVMQPLTKLEPTALIAQASASYADDPEVAKRARGLGINMMKLQRKILSQLHGRTCMSLICLLTFTLGAVLSMRMAGAMPLVVFIWSFVLALLAVIVTHGGDNIARDPDSPALVGLAVIWSGAAGAAASLAWAWRGLGRG